MRVRRSSRDEGGDDGVTLRLLRRLRLVRWCLVAAFAIQAHQASIAKMPFPGRVNNLLGEAMESRAARMGFSLADPRVEGTLSGMGEAAAGLVEEVAIGAAAGTALTWGALILGAVLVGAGIWYLTSDHGTSVRCDTAASCTLMRGSAYAKLGAGGTYYHSVSAFNRDVYCSEPAGCAAEVVTLRNNDHGNYGSGKTWSVGEMRAVSGGVEWDTYFVDSDGKRYKSFDPIGASGPLKAYSGTECLSGVAVGSNCVDVGSAPSEVKPLELPDHLPQTELDKPADPALMAQVANRLWQKAANTPGYSGFPYTATDPITTADMETLRETRPDLWPTVGDLTAPVAEGAEAGTQLQRVPLPANGTKTATDPGYVPEPAKATNPAAAQPLANLGPDPGTPAPDATADTPTASSILDPIFDMVPKLTGPSITVPAGTCPVFSGKVYTWDLKIDRHCDFIAEHAAAISAAMVLCWSIAATFIILRA
ncbi:hypothetical protein [Sphingomonas sp. BK069]|uniref:hypothetical protein n=1 Tax=Sphingomonas sp. BK069 TaxID=2586979 RepID=UPI00160A9F12|nr:hypothetical protein [Sphingomonas sp. BK069]MBB3345961.1 hypothetical protein [Sphingomonas sp. BK069]